MQKGVLVEDSLPEEYPYRDEGCQLSPSCLSCPLPRCRYDEPESRRDPGKELRDRAIRNLHRSGIGAPELASRFGLSKRSVYRILKGE